MIILLILLVCSALSAEPRILAAAQDECQPTSCNATGPIIRFPFRLRDRQPQHCGYSPDFDLSCNPENITEFLFQFPVRASVRNIVLPVTAKATVQEIDYAAQVIRVSVLNGSCLPDRVPELNSSAPPFETYNQYNWPSPGYALFNCSGESDDVRRTGPIRCLARQGFHVYAFQSVYLAGELSVSNCVKMYNVSDISDVILSGPREYSVDDTRLHWPEPYCGSCEAQGMYCRLKSNGTNGEIECLEVPRVLPVLPDLKKNDILRNVVIPVIVIGVLLMACVCIKKRKRDNEKRIKQYLEDYKALRPTRYTYVDIKKITDGFRFKLGQGGYGTVFKGMLSPEVPVAIKVLNNIKGNGEEFVNEVGTLGKIHHVNVVRLVGYCADGYRRALVYEFVENDTLSEYISLGNQNKTLGWEKLHQIALGIAKGIDYLHQGCNQRILHFDIKPQNILLDHNLNPKVADFGLAKLCSKEKSIVTMTAARGTIGYIAPEVFSRNFGNVSYKSDIYSFGMLLLDMVGARKNFNGRSEENSDIYFPEWMYNQLEKGEDTAIQIEREDESNLVKRLIIVGLWCIQWYPADRPSTKMVIKMLEGENMPIMPPNPFAASKSANRTASPSSGSTLSSEFYIAETSFD